MNDESMKKYKKARALIDGGMSVAQALKKAKMSTNAYYAAKKAQEKPPRKKTAPRFVDVPPAPTANEKRIAVIFGTPDEVVSVLRRMDQ